MRRLFPILLVAAACSKKDEPAGAASSSRPEPSAQQASAAAVAAPAPPLDPRIRLAVDRRVELLAILQHLAGNPSYSSAKGPYVDDVDRYFAEIHAHAAVRATAELRSKHGISYDAPMRLAVYVDDAFQPRRPLSPPPPGLDDPRFSGVDIPGYLESVRAFAAASRFDQFFREHGAYFAKLESTFAGFLAPRPVLPWFDGMFGVRRALYLLAPAVLVWPMNYGVRAVGADGNETMMQVMFLESPDAQGGFSPGDITYELCAHELAHSYVNPIVDAAMKDLEPVATPLFKRVEKAMRGSAYGTPTIMMEESVVRAVTLLYLREKSTPEHAAHCLVDQEKRGFAWTAELTDAIAALKAKGAPVAPAALVETVRATLAAWQQSHR